MQEDQKVLTPASREEFVLAVRRTQPKTSPIFYSPGTGIC